MSIRSLPLLGRHAGVQTTYSGQWGKSTFAIAMGQRRQLAIQVLHIYNTDNSIFNICKCWTGSFVCCPIATTKVLFPIDHCMLLDTSMSVV